MKSRHSPTLVPLRELPSDGREFEFSSDSGELDQALKDLIGTNSYSLKFHLKPQGNTFEIKGHLSTVLNLQCASCAGDFQLSVKQDLHEFILIENAMEKGDQMSRANHAHEWVEGAMDYVVLNDDVFDLGEYAHEAIALLEPIRPLCGAPKTPDLCVRVGGDRIERPWLSYGDEAASNTSIRPNPFEVLQKMKLKS